VANVLFTLPQFNNNDEEQIRLAKEYSTNTCVFSKDDMFCLGCHSDTHSEKMCGDCAIRNCGVKKSCNICAKGSKEGDIVSTFARLLQHDADKQGRV
jgi:hypothetical protein